MCKGFTRGKKCLSKEIVRRLKGQEGHQTPKEGGTGRQLGTSVPVYPAFSGKFGLTKFWESCQGVLEPKPVGKGIRALCLEIGSDFAANHIQSLVGYSAWEVWPMNVKAQQLVSSAPSSRSLWEPTSVAAPVAASPFFLSNRSLICLGGQDVMPNWEILGPCLPCNRLWLYECIYK